MENDTNGSDSGSGSGSEKPIRLNKKGLPDARYLPKHYKTGPDKAPPPPAPKDLMPKVISAVLGSKTMKQATQALTPEGKKYLSQALKQDVDVWRQEFAGKLRQASEELLDLTMSEVEKIPPAARAYTLAVLVDKAQVLEGKTALAGSAVNVQINNYGNVSKDDLIRKLRGEIDELPVAKPEEPDQA